MASGFTLIAVSEQASQRWSGFAVALEVTAWLSGLILLAMAGCRAISAIGLHKAIRWYGVGALAGNVAYLGALEGGEWKYTLGYPICIITLAAVSSRRGFGRILVPACLVAISLATGTRGLAATVLIAGLLSLLPLRRAAVPRQATSVARLLIVVSGVGIALATSIRNGYLGSALQAAYERQTEGTANVVLGSRVEWAAIVDLFTSRPFGFGLGVVPNYGFQSSALEAVARVGGNPSELYYQTNVFSDRVDLHSIAGNLWFHFGLAGVLLCSWLASTLVRGSLRLWHRRPTGALAAQFLIWQAGWDLLFSPMLQVNSLAIGCALALATRVWEVPGARSPAARRTDAGSAEDQQTSPATTAARSRSRATAAPRLTKEP